MPERALVVIPTYNERVNLPLIVPQILQQDPRLEVLVVDDNSPDGTGKLADELAAADARIHVLHRPGKAGLGKAYLAGFRWALTEGYDFIFEMDADFSHDPKFLPDFLRAIEHADLVIGSRYHTGVNVINWPIGRLLLSVGANEYARRITGLPLTDSTGGFKCFRRRVLEAIDLDRVRPSLWHSMTTDCPTCAGTGRVFTPEVVARRLERALKRAGHEHRERQLTVRLHPEVALYLLEEEPKLLQTLSKLTGLDLELRDDPMMRLDEFRLMSRPAGRDVTELYAVA